MDIQKRLFELRDTDFREFNAKLIPNIDNAAVIGVKTPALKELARELIASGEYKDYLLRLPHKYFEENQLHSFIISLFKDFDTALSEVERFLPYIDNWAVCDQLILKAFAKNADALLPKIKKWLQSGETYTVRFAIGLLMRYFLDERFEEKYLQLVANVVSDEYYINMMSAWYFATALAKQYDRTLPFFTEKKLSLWVHNKSIGKARESLRVSEEHKAFLKGLIRKQ